MYNKVILVGRLTRDIELRYSQGGMGIASTSIATNHNYTSNGEKKEEVCYTDITFFARSAEIANHSKAVIRLIKQSIRQLTKQAEKLVALIDALIESHEQLSTNRRLLETIKGIGEVTSRHLVAEIYAGRFHNAGQCAAYMGLVPIPDQSGKVKKVQLSRAGNRILKAKLYMAAISAKRHNPVLKAHYDKLIARGKCKMSALCAVMRRLVQISFGVIKHQKEFCLPA